MAVTIEFIYIYIYMNYDVFDMSVCSQNVHESVLNNQFIDVTKLIKTKPTSLKGVTVIRHRLR